MAMFVVVVEVVELGTDPRHDGVHARCVLPRDWNQMATQHHIQARHAQVVFVQASYNGRGARNSIDERDKLGNGSRSML